MENIKEIKVFLSCPEDLVREKDIVTTVDNFLDEENINLKINHKVRLDLTHWKKNVSLGPGSPRVQDRINTLVSYCDIYIGILWTRFGMSPGIRPDGIAHNSGTEEELFVAKKLGKDLWFFFCDAPINPSKIDPEQLKKVKEFKKRLQDQKILYYEYTEEKEFRKKLKSNIANWINKNTQINFIEQVSQSVDLPTSEDFKKFNKGF